jgi:hypothetical protein
VLHDGVRERISPNKLPVARWVDVIEAAHRAGLRSTATVMFGHVEEPWELAEHMRVIRACRSARRASPEFVPLPSSRSRRCWGRTHGVEELSREENLKHTAVFRLWRSAARWRRACRRAGSRWAVDDRHRGAALGASRPRRDADGWSISRLARARSTACGSIPRS